MAQRQVTEHTDDTDGSPADETVRFGVDGESYEIDLTTRHADELRAVLARYVVAGRRESRLARPVLHVAVRTEADPTAVRAWARSRGIEVNPRGRIPASVVERFVDAGN